MTALAFVAISIGGAPPAEYAAPPRAGQPPPGLTDLVWAPRLNSAAPLDLPFCDESGQSVMLRELARGRPVVLVLAYYRCPQLCNLVLSGLLDGLREVTLRPGADFEVVVVSFDPREGPEIARAKKESYVTAYARPGADGHWHFLTGDEPEIAQLAEAIGFHYRYDAAHDRFDHASGITILTPDGRVSRYLFGIRFLPRDLRLGIVEASAGQVGTVADQFMLYCFHYDPAAGKYAFTVVTLMRTAAALTVTALAFWLLRSWRRDRPATIAASER